MSNTDIEKWADERLNEVFMTDRFKELGKEDDTVFQSLVFLSKASEQLSLATTVLAKSEKCPSDIKRELKDIQARLHDLKDEIREV